VRHLRAHLAVLVLVAAGGSGTLIAQNGPTPIGLSDLLRGGWSNPKHYQPSPQTEGASDKAKLEQEKEDFDKSQKKAQERWDSGQKMADGGKEFYKKYAGYKDLMEEYDHLTPQDGPFDPDYMPPGTPQIPTSCTGAQCGHCFEDAYAQLTAVRVRFEKLRVVYGSTKAWIARALSFGDNASGISGFAGLAWQTERRKIEASVANLDRSYDNKYNELMGTLETSLKAIEACEAKHFNNPDWYNRFGYMFHSFIADRYRR